MKRTIILFIIAIFAFTGGKAQYNNNNLTITDFALSSKGQDKVDVFFKVNAGEKAVKSDYNLILTPVLSKGTEAATLPSIVVQGKRARISQERKMKSNRTVDSMGNSIIMHNNEVAEYATSIPYQDWMEGADLRLERVSKGCCEALDESSILIAEKLAIKPVEIVAPQPEKLTAGDLMAQKYSFVVPMSEYSKDIKYDNSSTVYFRQSKIEIDPAYMSNAEVLDRITTAIKTIENSNDSKVVKVLITGFASPEGSLALNNKLAIDRATTFEKYLLTHSPLKENVFDVHNGSVDWERLKELVAASNMSDRDAILKIIENTPVGDSINKNSRLGELKSLKGGEPYRYLYKHFFPELRNATYLKVFYENINK